MNCGKLAGIGSDLPIKVTVKVRIILPTLGNRALPNSAMLGLEHWYHASLFVPGY